MVFRYEPVSSLLNDVFSLTEPVEPAYLPRWSPFGPSVQYPYVNVAEYKDEIHVVAEIPGIPKESVKIQLHDGVLTISGERKAPEEQKDSEWLRNEIRYGSFSRSIELPERVNEEKVNAEYSNGVLTIVLPKHEAAKPKEIVIH
jgi:HSP20 family protein